MKFFYVWALMRASFCAYRCAYFRAESAFSQAIKVLQKKS